MTAYPPALLPFLGRRIVLRRLSPADLADFQAYRHDPQVGLYQGWTPWPDTQAAAFLAAMSNAPLFEPRTWCQIGIADRPTGTLIGDIGIHVAAGGQEAEIGFSLRAQSQGLGLATEAVSAAIRLLFEHTAVTRLIGIIDARNLPSIRLLERLGMQRVAVIHTIFRGEPCEEYRYALASTLRKEASTSAS